MAEGTTVVYLGCVNPNVAGGWLSFNGLAPGDEEAQDWNINLDWVESYNIKADEGGVTFTITVVYHEGEGPGQN